MARSSSWSLFLNVGNLLCAKLLEVKNNVLLMYITPSAPNPYHTRFAQKLLNGHAQKLLNGHAPD